MMAPYLFALSAGLYGLAMLLYPRLFGRLFSTISKLDPATRGIDPKQRENRDGFVRAAGVAMIFVALFFIYTLEVP